MTKPNLYVCFRYILGTFVALLCCKDQTKPTEPAEPAAVQTTKLPYK